MGTVVLEPGAYVAYCHVQSPDKVIHVAKGVIKTVVVTTTSALPAPRPHVDLTVTLDDHNEPPSTHHNLYPGDTATGE